MLQLSQCSAVDGDVDVDMIEIGDVSKIDVDDEVDEGVVSLKGELSEIDVDDGEAYGGVVNILNGELSDFDVDNAVVVVDVNGNE